MAAVNELLSLLNARGVSYDLNTTLGLPSDQIDRMLAYERSLAPAPPPVTYVQQASAAPVASRSLEQLIQQDQFVITAQAEREIPRRQLEAYIPAVNTPATETEIMATRAARPTFAVASPVRTRAQLPGAGGFSTELAGVGTISGGRSIPVDATSALAGASGPAGGIVGLGCSLIPNATARRVCEMAGGYVADRVLGNSGGSSGSAAERTLTGQENCPDGYKKDANGVCRVDTVLGGRLPGDVGRPDTVWTPVNGLYGVGVTPVLVQSAKRACPAGFVLGKDGVCYERLGRTQRAHNPGARPLLTGGDMNALKRAKSLQKKIGSIARGYGKKPCSCGPKGRRKK